MELDFECYLEFVFLQGHGQLDKYKAMLGYVECYALELAWLAFGNGLKSGNWWMLCLNQRRLMKLEFLEWICLVMG